MKHAVLIWFALGTSALASNFRETVTRSGGDQPVAGQPVTIVYEQFQNPGCPQPATVQLHLGINGSWSIQPMTGTVSCAPFSSSGSARYTYTVPAQSAGAVVEYVVRVWLYPGNTNANWRKAGSDLAYNEWNTGYTYYGNSNNFRFVTAEPQPVAWMGNTWHWPESGITASDTIWMHTETWPAGAAKDALLVYSTDGATWRGAWMFHDGAPGANDKWAVGIGPFPSGTVVRYAVAAHDAAGNTVWDNLGGDDYYATVSGAKTVQSISAPRLSPGSGQIEPGTTVDVFVDVAPAGAAVLTHANFTRGEHIGWSTGNALHIVAVSNGVETWRGRIGPFYAGDTGQCAVVTIGGDNSTLWANNGGANYRFTVKNSGQHLQWVGNTWQYPANGQLRATDDLWINVETWPKGAASQVFVGYNVGGVWCCSEELSRNGTAGNNDAWHVNLGRFAPGVVKYFLWVIDDYGAWYYDNNGGRDFSTVIN